jgi:hypothetical protein
VKPYVLALLVVVAVLGGFYGGYKVGHTTVSANTNTPNQIARVGAGAGAGAGQTRGGFGAVCPSPGTTSATGAQALARGTISNLSSSTLTVTNPNCDVKVTLGANITISKTVTGSTADLKNSLTVTIMGTRQADGSILAQTIQISAGPSAGPSGG